MLNKKVMVNHMNYVDRCALFKRFGYDIEKEREFILKQALPLNGQILEVGTGKGHFALTLAGAGYRFTSVDVSEEEQNYARMNIEYFGFEKQVDLQISDAGQLIFEDQSFDVVFAVNLLHHLTDPEKVAGELARVVKERGKIIVSDFSEKGMEMVGKVHQSEGRVHPRGTATVHEMKDYFLGRSFRAEMRQTDFQETVIAYRPGREEP